MATEPEPVLLVTTHPIDQWWLGAVSGISETIDRLWRVNYLRM